MTVDIGTTELNIKEPAYHYHFVINDSTRQVVKIMKGGRVVLSPGVTLDEASLAFWRGLEESVPGICQRILDERKERKP